MSVHAWLIFAMAAWVIALIPGPAVTMIVGHALASGRRAGLIAAAGATLGNAIAMSLSLMGVGALLNASAAAFTLLKFAGAMYLVYLGLRLIAKSGGAIPEHAKIAGEGRTFGAAVLVTTFNPKTIVFFVAFVPQFISTTLPALPQAIVLLLTFTIIVGTNDALYALAASRASEAFRKLGVRRWLDRAGGGVLIGAGVATALAGNK